MNKYIIILMAVLLNSCGSKNTSPENKTDSVAETKVSLTEAQIKNAGIETGVPVSKTMSSILKVNGVIDVPPQNMVSISFPLGGYLKSTKLLPGMHVAKGEALAVLEDPQYIQLQQDYLMAKAKLNIL